MALSNNKHLEDNVDLAKDVIITTSGGVSIGERTLIGYRTQIISADHTIPPIGEKDSIREVMFTSSPNTSPSFRNISP